MTERDVDAFRTELRSWLEQNVPDGLRPENAARLPEAERIARLRAWQRKLAEARWVGITWPVEYGGRGAGIREQIVYVEEMARARAPEIIGNLGIGIAGPPILAYGTEEQKRRFARRILSADDLWCFGFSEPGAGSDLASLRTQAGLDGDHFVVTGQKVWTTLGHHADWCMLLARTDPSSRRSKGISCLLVDMKSPGITVRPIVLLDGSKEVNEVFFDEVRVPAENLVHEEGKGWTVAKYLLGYERMGTGRIGASKRELAKLKELAGEQMKDGRPIIEDPRFRDRLTRVEVELMALEITNLRFLDQMRRSGRPPGADVSMLKIKGTEIQQAITELMMQAAGPLAQAFRPVDAMDFDHFTARLAPRYCNLRKATIYAGSNEIQRNIIAKATLGL
jgi:hypothetical protein